MNRIAAVALLLVALFVGSVATPQGAAAAGPRTASANASTNNGVATPVAPSSLNLFVASGFRFQDPNPYACTSTSAMDVLNFIAIRGMGGSGFRWQVTLSGATRDGILAWERTHDTLAGGNGSDPHGLRNALNYYGWGSQALYAGYRTFDDYSFSSYDGAVKSVVRALIRTRKPAAILAWAGRHVQMVTGYYGLSGDPFAKDSLGRYTNAFTVAGFYLSDPLYSQAWVNRAIAYSTLKSTGNLKMRFRPYIETDSPYDDPYTAGTRPARDEWYGRWVVVMPIR
jgi:hypothetical protein